MSFKCKITGKKPMAARNVSHAHNVTPRWQRPNIQKKRTITKKGLMRYLRDEGLTLKDVTR